MSGDYTTVLKPARPPFDALPYEMEVQVTYESEHSGLQRVTLKRRRTTFGRVEADILIADPTLSRKHFQLEVSRGGLVLQDLASANGTIYKGRWITFANLHDGDHFQAGGTRFHVMIRASNVTPAKFALLTAVELPNLESAFPDDQFVCRTIEPGTFLETCRTELPDAVVLPATEATLAAVEMAKRLPRIKHTRVWVSSSLTETSLAERFRALGAEVLDVPLTPQVTLDMAAAMLREPLRCILNFPITIHPEGEAEFHARVTSLDIRMARLQTDVANYEPGTPIQVKMILPNDYGVVQARGQWGQDWAGQPAVRLSAYEGKGALTIRRIIRDYASRPST